MPHTDTKKPTTENNTKPSPFCVRLSLEERATLEGAAAGLPLGEHIRRCLFNADKPTRRRAIRSPIKDQKALAEVLGKLGQSRLAANINQIARAVNTSTLVVTPEIRQAILTSAADIAEMRRLLIRALSD